MAFGLQYDGANDLVNIASPVTIGMTNDGSITIPFKRTDTSNGQGLFGLQSGTGNLCQILNNSQLFFRLNNTSATFNLSTSLVLDGEYVFKFKRVSNIWSLVDEFDNQLAPETINTNANITIDQVGAFNGGTLSHSRLDGFIIEELGVVLQSLVNTTGTGSVWPDAIGSADGTLVNFPTDDSQWIDLGGGGISVTVDSGTYLYNGTDVSLITSRILTVNSGTYNYTGTSVNLVRGLVLNADTGNYTYTGADATLTFTPAGAFILTADSGVYAYTGTDINFNRDRVIIASSGTYTYSGTNIQIILPGQIWTDKPTVSTTWTNQAQTITIWTDK